ncbi:MAG: DUF2442 domain-containing protein [Ignavibacteria bacterium]|nr:DUF2442 domain-containing protein [Ignavibacteria bacterium]
MSTSIIGINKAQYLNNYKIELLFNDGKKRVIDLNNFLKKSKNPMTRKYLNKNSFKKFKVEYGDLIWGIMKCVFLFGICTKEIFLKYILSKKNKKSGMIKKVIFLKCYLISNRDFLKGLMMMQ